MPNGKLTPKQELFVAEYLKDFNAHQAAVRAGFSEVGAESYSIQLLRNPKVGAAIAERNATRLAKVDWDATKVLIRLIEMADADIADILDGNGNYKPISEWPIVWRRMLQGCDVEETFERSKDGGDASWDKTGQVVKIKFIDRLKNLELLGRHVNIKAFEQASENHLHIHLASKVEDRLTRARTIEAESVA